ncbi:GyrI-like domain-containing protein [Nocardia blacklockiae]|uniref:GyrI-like domain-containing protein n=1 Tax=Nocardia blacklockiae TaxID=480036 RepID=UPI001895CEA6|nr:GyrI-like domain-containing protein [Nocardia blacklockiae]MBF6175618.1 GyrI-like domain-containing protein [Nocardia blacklockiae]
MAYRVDVCEVAPQAVLRLPREVRPDRLGEDIAAGMRELAGTVRRAGLTASGASGITFFDEQFADHAVVVDFGVPVEPAPTLSPSSGAEVLVVPGMRVARTCHRGSYADLDAAYRALRAWVREAGYRPSGPPTEVYLVGPDEVSRPHQLITEIRLPVVPSPAVTVRLDRPFAATLDLVRKTVGRYGFEVLSEIDVRAGLRAALGERIEDYVLLGLDNPLLTARALAADRTAGLLLPWQVVVRADDTGTLVQSADPDLLVRVSGQEELRPVAEEARGLLTAVLDALRTAPE